ncbi:hypothetical protein PYCCODRAFT_1192344 [Trametes coccinea BRFM310]|uniref:F-box domain-containing protein n=1 Tax=Trametes coccinea (strain BRFM310) TaxID=1353009 RepID=A0A1Y2I7Q9_TRAC3|nr:hypothetical protein PYCCODRAFT_1192344 [Trametes coccinea BRFM310]
MRCLYGRTHQSPVPILQLPSEIHCIIIEHAFPGWSRELSWFASLATVCRTLLPHVEICLYGRPRLYKCKSAKVFLRSVNKPESRHRATAVRALTLDITRAATITSLFGHAFPKFTNVCKLRLRTTTMVLFDVLLETRPHLRQLHVSGSQYPPRFHDMLRAQPQLEDLMFNFGPRYKSADYLVPLAEEGGGAEQHFPPLADGALLPSLKALRLTASVFPPTLVTYAYSITTLMLLTPTHKQTTYALGLFSPTIISLSVWQPLSSHCPTRCFSPTSVLDGVRLPKLRILQVVQQCSYELRPHMERSDYPGIDAKSIMALRESCGMLETIIWGVECYLLNSLYAGRESGNAPIQRYARLLVDTIPHLVRFAAYNALRGHNTVDGYIHGDIWTRASLHGDEPVNDVVDELVWENDAIAAEQTESS